MKILQVVPFFGPQHGGSFIVPFQLSKALVKKGHEVTMITSDYKFDKDFAEQNKDIEIIPFKSLVNVCSFYYTPSMKKWLKNNLKYFDIIHLHNYRSYQNNILIALTENKKKNIVLQPHGSYPKVGGKTFIKSLYDMLWGNKIVNLSCVIIAVSAQEKRQLMEGGILDDMIRVIPNGLDIDHYQELPTRNEFRRELGIDETTKLVLFVGRLHRIKGIDFLIKAFALVAKEKKDMRLVIAGPDFGQLSYLKSMVKNLGIENEVIFYGHIADARKAYVACDLLVYPSAYEIFGLVPFEAILCGAPVIVTSDCGCGEIIKEGNCGSLVGYGDPDGLAEKINQLLGDNNLSKNLVANGQVYISQNLSWDGIICTLEDVYENCVHNL